MELKVIYDKGQLESTIDFIATHNTTFIGKHKEIREAILENMDTIIKDYPKYSWISTMGVLVLASLEEREGIDSDHNVMEVEFWVDASVSFSYEYVEKTYVRGQFVNDE